MDGEQKSWYVSAVKKGQEEKVARRLQQKGHTCYVPMNRQVLPNGQERKAPLFPQYIFVQVKAGSGEKLLLQKEISHLLHFGSRPCVIDEHSIEMIRLFVQHYHNILLEKVPVDLEAQPLISQTPMHGIKGASMSRQYALVRLLLPSLGTVLVAEGLAPEVITQQTESENIFTTSKTFSN